MHMRSEGLVHKFLMLGIREENVSQITCKENLGILIHHILMVKEEVKMMLNPSYLGSERISSCTTMHIT
jgi:hypothetical protein